VKFRTKDGSTWNTETSQLLQQYIIREAITDRPTIIGYPRERTIGREVLYKTKADGKFWRREQMYPNGGGHHDIAIPLTEGEARAWLKDRFGWWKRFKRLEDRVFEMEAAV
jgi:hypothetical protein